jgi:hypothetical protein
MICPTCQGKGIVPAPLGQASSKHWDGSERRQEPRWTGNDALRFMEAEHAR